jgi:hypothetical protein
MGDSSQDARPEGAPSDHGRKQPYQKPAVSWEEPLEVRPALTANCLKISGSGEPCDSGPGS